MNALISAQPSFFDQAVTRPEPRPYQERMIREILGWLARGRNPAACLPEAGGKGLIIAAVTEAVEAHGWEVWSFAHRKELITQISGHLGSLGVEHGIIAPWAPLTDCPTQVCSVDTVRARMGALKKRLSRVRLIIDDECHHSTSATRVAIRQLCPGAQFLGLSATMFRQDGKALGDVYDCEVRGPTRRELEDEGYISRVEVIAPPASLDLSRVKRQMGDWVASQLDAAVDNEDLINEALRSYALYAGGLPFLGFCPGVSSAASVARKFRAAGWAVAVLEAEMRSENLIPGQPIDREGVARALKNGRLQGVFQVGMAGEGTDWPNIAVGIDLRPTQSTQLWLQHLGRTKRVIYAPGMPMETADQRLAAIAAGDKPSAIWLDLVGNWSRHGMPNADRPWSLDGGVKGLERAVAGVRRCGRCHHVAEKGPERCPTCHRKFPPAPRNTKLSEAELASLPGFSGLSAEQIADLPLNRLLDLAKTDDDVRTIARIRSYKPFWISQVLQARRGDIRRRA